MNARYSLHSAQSGAQNVTEKDMIKEVRDGNTERKISTVYRLDATVKSFVLYPKQTRKISQEF